MGARFTYGFLTTTRGKMLASGVFDQLNNGALEGLKFGVIHALLRVGDVASAELSGPNTPLKGDRLEKAHERDKFFFGMFQRDPKCMEKADARITEEMDLYNGVADTYLAHWRMAYFTNIVDDRKTSYAIYGDKGPQRLAEGVSNFTQWGANRVYMVRAYAARVSFLSLRSADAAARAATTSARTARFSSRSARSARSAATRSASTPTARRATSPTTRKSRAPSRSWTTRTTASLCR